MKCNESNNKILIVGQITKNAGGGQQVRKRNYSYLSEYFGKDNVDYMLLNHEVMGSKSIKEHGLIKVFFKYVYDCLFLLKLLVCSFSLNKYSYIYFDQSNFRFSSFFGRKQRKIVFFHNIESSYLDQMYKDKTPYEKKYIQSIFDTEKWIVNNSEICIAINERDSLLMKSLYNKNADFILPVTFKDRYISKEVKSGGYMLFVGSNFFGNTDGLFWFIDNCMNKINKKLLVVGTGMDKYQVKYNQKNIEFLGYVEDLATTYEKADFVILPIISGGGMKVKTCEALMYGKRIIGTKEAFEGYNCVDGKNCIICNTTEEFIDTINRLSNDTVETYVDKNRRYFLDNFEDNIVKEKFFNFLESKLE